MGTVSDHSANVARRAEDFSEQISSVVGATMDDLEAYLQRSTEVDKSGERLASSTKNASAISMLPAMLRQSLSRVGYYDTVSDFAVSMQDQVGYFRRIYDEDSGPLDLPEMSIDGESLELLTSAASLSVVAIESSVEDAANRLARLAPRMLGNEPMSSMVRETRTIVRKIANVKSMAIDQVMLFYRLLANSVYKSVEAENHPLTYSLVGPDDTTSESCLAIMTSGNRYSWSQLHTLVNDDETSFAHSGGHFGCRHWFRATGRA